MCGWWYCSRPLPLSALVLNVDLENLANLNIKVPESFTPDSPLRAIQGAPTRRPFVFRTA